MAIDLLPTYSVVRVSSIRDVRTHVPGRLSEYGTQLEAAFARFGAPLTTEVDQPGSVRPRPRLGVVGLRLLYSWVSRDRSQAPSFPPSSGSRHMRVNLRAETRVLSAEGAYAPPWAKFSYVFGVQSLS